LFFAEKFLDLTHLGSLQVTDFGCNLIQRGGDHGEGGEIVRVPVTLDYLRRYGGRLQTQTRADLLFNFRREMRKDTNRTGELANSQILGSPLKRAMLRCVSEYQLAILKPK